MFDELVNLCSAICDSGIWSEDFKKGCHDAIQTKKKNEARHKEVDKTLDSKAGNRTAEIVLKILN